MTLIQSRWKTVPERQKEYKDLTHTRKLRKSEWKSKGDVTQQPMLPYIFQRQQIKIETNVPTPPETAGFCSCKQNLGTLNLERNVTSLDEQVGENM